ncbi:MAG: hypothetical protein MHM6MM_006406 [Cercozoa sp. M6MM]
MQTPKRSRDGSPSDVSKAKRQRQASSQAASTSNVRASDVLRRHRYFWKAQLREVVLRMEPCSFSLPAHEVDDAVVFERATKELQRLRYEQLAAQLRSLQQLMALQAQARLSTSGSGTALSPVMSPDSSVASMPTVKWLSTAANCNPPMSPQMAAAAAAALRAKRMSHRTPSDIASHSFAATSTPLSQGLSIDTRDEEDSASALSPTSAPPTTPPVVAAGVRVVCNGVLAPTSTRREWLLRQLQQQQQAQVELDESRQEEQMSADSQPPASVATLNVHMNTKAEQLRQAMRRAIAQTELLHQRAPPVPSHVPMPQLCHTMLSAPRGAFSASTTKKRASRNLDPKLTDPDPECSGTVPLKPKQSRTGSVEVVDHETPCDQRANEPT